MATKNFFDLLGDDENEDPAQVVVRANSLAAADAKPAAAANAGTKKPAAAAAKLPSKPAPPSEAGTCVCVCVCVCGIDRGRALHWVVLGGGWWRHWRGRVFVGRF